jgi:hypothetical protein
LEITDEILVSGNMVDEQEDTEKPKRSSLIWNAQKKRPSIFVFVVIILMTISIFFLGIITISREIHVIRVVIEYGGPFKGEIRIDGIWQTMDGESNEYIYDVREGTDILVQIDKLGTRTDPITISIYDNDELVASRTSIERLNPTTLSYTVEDH